MHLPGDLGGLPAETIWNLAEIGIVGPSIINNGDQVVGNTFALYRKTLEQIGGLERYGNFIAEDIAIGRSAYESNFSIMLGPLIESPVGKMSFSRLIDKYSRAALYAITMRDLRKNWQFVCIYSYLLVLLPPVILFDTDIVLVSVFLALGRLALASYLWFLTTGEKRIFIECFMGDFLFILTYLRSLFFRIVTWSGHAKSWLANARAAGYRTGSVAQAGAIIVLTEGGWQGRRYGHVAYVESVNNGWVTISEMNYNCFACKSVRTLKASDWRIRGYIY